MSFCELFGVNGVNGKLCRVNGGTGSVNGVNRCKRTCESPTRSRKSKKDDKLLDAFVKSLQHGDSGKKKKKDSAFVMKNKALIANKNDKSNTAAQYEPFLLPSTSSRGRKRMQRVFTD